MLIFHGYVSLPEGNNKTRCELRSPGSPGAVLADVHPHQPLEVLRVATVGGATTYAHIRIYIYMMKYPQYIYISNYQLYAYTHAINTIYF